MKLPLKSNAEYPPKPPWTVFSDLLKGERPICDTYDRRLGDWEVLLWFSFLMTLPPAVLRQYALDNPAPPDWQYAYEIVVRRREGMEMPPRNVDDYLLGAAECKVRESSSLN